MALPLWVQHIVALFRGSHGQIVSDLDSVTRRLKAHAQYKEHVSNVTFMRADALDVKAAKASDEADKARRGANKIAELFA